MDSQKKATYRQLFLSTLKLSACTFGGGFVIIPLMRRRFVDELGWIGEQEMLDFTAIAQSSPGAIAVNASILVGYHVAGVPGALVTVAGTVLPPLGILSVVSLFYGAFRDSRVVSLAMAGMLCAVAAVILDVVLGMVGALAKQRRLLPLMVLAGAFVAVRFLGANILLVMALSGLIGAVDALRKGKGGNAP